MARAVLSLRDFVAAAARSVRKCRRSYCACVGALLGTFAGLLRMPEWRAWRGPLPRLLCLFLAVITESTAFAALYSGWSIALGSAARAALFGIGVYVFLYVYSAAARTAERSVPVCGVSVLRGAAGAPFRVVTGLLLSTAGAGRIRRTVHLGRTGCAAARAGAVFTKPGTLGNFCALFPGDDSGVLLPAKDGTALLTVSSRDGRRAVRSGFDIFVLALVAGGAWR